MSKSNKPLWVKLAMSYFDDVKFDCVSPMAELLYVRSVSFAKNDNTGFLSVKAVARLASDLGDVEVLKQELLNAGLWIVDGDALMIENWSEWQEDASKVEARREAGRLAAQRRGRSPIGSPSGSPSGSGEGIPLQEQSKSRDRDISNTLTEFAEFWSAYPRKVGIGDARKAWKSIEKVRPPVQELIRAVEAAKAGWVDPKFIPYPATWLRGQRWADGAVEPVRRAERPCGACLGTGRKDYGSEAGKEPCRSCGGSGRVPEPEK